MFFTGSRQPPPICSVVPWARYTKGTAQLGSCLSLIFLMPAVAPFQALPSSSLPVSRRPEHPHSHVSHENVSPHSCQNQMKIANTIQRVALDNSLCARACTREHARVCVCEHVHVRARTHTHTLLLGLATQWECKHVVNALALSWLPRWLKFNRFFPLISSASPSKC